MGVFVFLSRLRPFIFIQHYSMEEFLRARSPEPSAVRWKWWFASPWRKSIAAPYEWHLGWFNGLHGEPAAAAAADDDDDDDDSMMMRMRMMMMMMMMMIQ